VFLAVVAEALVVGDADGVFVAGECEEEHIVKGESAIGCQGEGDVVEGWVDAGDIVAFAVFGSQVGDLVDDDVTWDDQAAEVFCGEYKDR